MADTTPVSVPILNLERQYQQIGSDLESRVLSVLRGGNFILGDNLKELESGVAHLCHTDFAVGVANGTDALILALWALDIGPGDEVITTAFTFAATAEAICLRGAKPVFVDIDQASYNLDPSKIEAAITARTKAILPVHLYGQPCDMAPILSLAEEYGLKVVEDNAQAIGALYRGNPTGSLGHVACISFYPTKNLGACGDAGMVVTRDQSTADRLRILRAHGSNRRYYHDELGVNSRLDEVQAAVLLSKLDHLAQWNEKRRQIAAWYTSSLTECDRLIPPATLESTVPVWHQYTVSIENRDEDALPARDYVQAELASRGIGSMCYYPLPLHLQPAFSYLGYTPGDLPSTEKAASEVLSLPMYPELEMQEVLAVAGACRDILGRKSSASYTVNIPVLPATPVLPGT